jgi:hypothetical protein
LFHRIMEPFHIDISAHVMMRQLDRHCCIGGGSLHLEAITRDASRTDGRVKDNRGRWR